VGLKFGMFIKAKLPGGMYPQITQFPAHYTDFLAAFRGGRTIDDNLTAFVIAATPQAAMLKIAISSGHLTKVKNMAIPDESLADISLTELGAEQVLTPQDKQYCKMAVDLARQSIAENDGEPHPFVGAVVVKDGQVISTGFRGERNEGDHAEYCALRKLKDDVDHVDLSGCTVYTTLEPCSIRKPGKTPCTNRLINAKVARVVYGLADKDETVFGHSTLSEAGVEIGLFPKVLIEELLILNKKWSHTRRQPVVVPPPNDTPPLAYTFYYKRGTPMTEQLCLLVRPPKDAAGSYTIENQLKDVLAHAKTFEDIAIKWKNIDAQKTIVEKLDRMNRYVGDPRLNLS
jgi:pyrimidine deaminase RibD-like protein